MRTNRSGAATLALAASLIALLALSATALAATRYASPTGAGAAPCEAPSTPCALDPALAAAEAGDEVELAPGTYDRGSRVDVPDGVHMRGASREDRSRIVSDGDVGVRLGGPDATVSDLDVTKLNQSGTAALIVATGAAERVRASTDDGYACFIYGGLLRDSACVVIDPGSFGIALNDGFNSSHESLVVNSTLYASGSVAIVLGAGMSVVNNDTELRLVNTIAHGDGEDLQIRANHSGGTATLATRNSNHGAPDFFGGEGIEVYEDLGGNQAAAPLFRDAAGGDLREAPGSPTVDAGDPGAAIGPLDLAGEARVQGDRVDIGAYEFTPPPDDGGEEGESGDDSEEDGADPGPGPVDPAPTLWGLRVAPNVVLTGQRRRPAVVAYRLSESARTVFLVQRALPGVRVRARGEVRCARPNRATRRLLRRKARRCQRWRRAGVLRRAGQPGVNRFRFNGRVGRRLLRPGRYRLIALAVDAARQRSEQPRLRGFRVRAIR